MTVYTIGYEGLNLEMFMSLLTEHGVETVVDVRELPLSRKPGFSKKTLAGALTHSGVDYVHMGDLGCPRPVRDSYRENGDWGRYTKGFLKHLQDQEGPIAKLSDLVQASNCALLCYEADFRFCHRSMVAEAIRDNCGADIQHIKGAAARKASPAAPLPAFV